MEPSAIKLLIDLQHEAYRKSLETFVNQVTTRVDSLQATVVEQARAIDFTRSELGEIKSLFKVLLAGCCGAEGRGNVRQRLSAWGTDNRDEVEAWDGDGRGCMNGWDGGDRRGFERRGNRKQRSSVGVSYAPEPSREEATLCVDGLAEEEMETDDELSNRLSGMLRDKLGLSEIHLRYCRRMGQADENHPRTIVARFCQPKDRDAILGRAGDLEGSGLTLYRAWHSTQPAHPHQRAGEQVVTTLRRKRGPRTRHKGQSSAKFAALGHITPLESMHDLNGSAASLPTSDSTASFLDLDGYTEEEDEEFLAGPDTGVGRQVVSLHIGQAGVQVGRACWELYCLEHGIFPDGVPYPTIDESSLDPFFSETSSGKMVPRSLFIDLEPSVVDEIHHGTHKELFHSSSFITHMEDAANNFARGRYTVGKAVITKVLDGIRKQVEACSGLQGFTVTHSLGGGTGSGFMTLLLEKLTQEYCSTGLLRFCIFPSPRMSTAVVEPYNTVLHAATTMDYEHCVFVSDNEATYKLCVENLGMTRPNYRNLNQLVAQVISSSTASLRFDGALNVDLRDFNTNLVPLRRLHFPVMAFAPIISPEAAACDQRTVADMTTSCFEPKMQMATCDPTNGKYMSCCLLYRGDVTPNDVQRAISAIKLMKTVQFVEWCPTGFKLGINGGRPTLYPSKGGTKLTRAVCMLANTTAFKDTWRGLTHKFDLMYSKRAFVHWYTGEGLEECELADAQDTIAQMIRDYEEVERDGKEVEVEEF
ncbi:hypothetical protein O3P69_005586 [Scylla paramamosain]|uniref:Tubulin alpha chain n=1 Tax=Scylla paramamosain TaxID=85552 RepID=A0AAW0U773_SCYPA